MIVDYECTTCGCRYPLVGVGGAPWLRFRGMPHGPNKDCSGFKWIQVEAS